LTNSCRPALSFAQLVKVQLKNGTDAERRTKEQLERILASYDLSRYKFTHDVIIEREGLLAPDRIKPLHTFPASKGPNGWTPDDKELCVLSAMTIEAESVELPKAEPVVAEMIWSRECPVCLKTLVKKHLSQVLRCVCGWEWGA